MAHLLEDKKTPLHLKTNSKIFNLHSWLLKNLLEKGNYWKYTVYYAKMCVEQQDVFPPDNHFYDLLVQDSAVLTVCFHYSVLWKRIIFVFDPEIWIAKTDGHN